MRFNEITSAVIGAAIRVHRELGPGILESAYRACLTHDLVRSGLQVERERPVPVVYDGCYVECGFRADLIVVERVVVECKAKAELHPIDFAQTLSHLRLLDFRVGLLINFHELVLRDGIHRLVNKYRPD